MTTAIAKITKPAKKATKKPAKKAAKKGTKIAKPAKPEPTDAMIDRVVDLVDDANDMIADLDEACAADTVDEYNDAVAQASKKLARVMRGMAALAGKLDPEAFAAAQTKARQLPVLRAPALPQ
jgi:hypothetical protein